MVKNKTLLLSTTNSAALNVIIVTAFVPRLPIPPQAHIWVLIVYVSKQSTAGTERTTTMLIQMLNSITQINNVHFTNLSRFTILIS